MYRQALQLMRVGNELSVLSVGCGALLDYRGLQMALGDVDPPYSLSRNRSGELELQAGGERWRPDCGRA